ncbi:hypothetical protein ACH4U6_22380 [Streptomyces netropsis]|uniref:hypothetical protein n=1 Tax=Streptomyces netropsis TaxID=55404 RepID=UPI0037ADC1F9
MSSEAIRKITVTISFAGTGAGSNPKGYLRLGMAGREFVVRHMAEQEFDKNGGTYTFTLGEDHSVQDHVSNDPQNPQTYVRSLDLFPNYIRYDTPSGDDLIVEAVRAVVSGTSYDYEFNALVGTDPKGSKVRLGRSQGQVLHLSQHQVP